MLLVHKNTIWRPRFIKFSYWTHKKLWNWNCINQQSVNLNNQITLTRTLCWTQKPASSFRTSCNLKNHTSECISYFTKPNLCVYATSFKKTYVYLQNYWIITTFESDLYQPIIFWTFIVNLQIYRQSSSKITLLT